MRSSREFAAVRSLARRGMNHRPEPFPWLTHHAYAYLLGLYLGDGYLASMPRTHCLRLYMDAKYPRIAHEAATAVGLVNPSGTASVHPDKHWNMVIVSGYSKAWPALLPQHGAGLKHHRSMKLAGWQQAICLRFPDRLLRGLIHSDGSRYINTIRHPNRVYRYPRYEFSNRSDDIKEIFCRYCDELGIRWRRMNESSISVARRESVAILDRLVGPKR